MKRKSMTLFIALAVTLGSVGIAGATTDLLKPKFHPVQAHEKIDKSKDGLTKYKKANKQKLAQLKNDLGDQDKAFVTITLSKPLNANQLNKLIKEHNLDVQHVIARSVEDNGLRGTLLLEPTSDGTVNKQMMNDMLIRHQAKLKGFVEVVAHVPTANLDALSADQSVFVADPSADPHLVPNSKKKYIPGLFWNLEDNNMVEQTL